MLQILQDSDKAIINWGDFSIGLDEATQFLQPGSTAAVLNRVTGGNASALEGLLQANGRVFLINPNGILVGPNARIDTAGFLASTLDLSDENFLGGGDLFFSGSSPAAIVNLGAISASEGDVFLIANQVSNQGNLSAPNGTVGLGAGTEILLAESGNERMFVRGGVGGAVGVDNAGAIEAQVSELKAGGSIYATAIRNSGRVRATSVHREGGRIMLKADGGAISNVGRLEASNGDGSSSVEIDGGIGGNVAFEMGSTADADRVMATTQGGNLAVNEGAAIVATAIDLRAPSGSIAISGEVTGRDSPLAPSQISLDASPGGSVEIGPTGNVQGSEVAMNADLGAVRIQPGGTVAGNVIQIRAEGGEISHFGTIKSEDVAGNGGSVSMATGAGGTVEVGGVIDAKGGIGNGGSISVTGEEVSIRSGALLDASGETGGGQILVGGSYQGSDPTVFNSQRTIVEAGAVLKADALSSGNGGTIVVWSDDETVFRGSISATAVGEGKGGLAEVSGKKTLTFEGLVDLSAEAEGNSGVLLLDPTNFTIDSSTAGSIEATLGTGTSVTVLTDAAGADDGDVFVDAPINVLTNPGIFTILAHDDIFVTESIQIGGTGGALNLVAGWDGSTGFTTVPSAGVADGSVANIADIADSAAGFGVGDAGDRGNVVIGGDGGVWVGSQSGPTAILGYDVSVGAASGIGYRGATGTDINGNISVVAKGGVSVTHDGSISGASGIGHRSFFSTPAISSEVDVLAETGDISLQAAAGYDIRIGHEGMDAVSGGIHLDAPMGTILLKSGNGGSVSVGGKGNKPSGEIVVDGKMVSLDASAGGTVKVGGDDTSGVGSSGAIAIRGFNGVSLFDEVGGPGQWEIGHGNFDAGGLASNLIFLSNDLMIGNDLVSRLIEPNLIGGTVTVGGYGDVTVGSDITIAPNNDLEFLATGDLSLQSNISNESNGDVAFIAGWDGSTGVDQMGPPAFNRSALAGDLNSFGNNEGKVTTNGLVDMGSGDLEIYAQSVYVDSMLADIGTSTMIQLSNNSRMPDANGLTGGLVNLKAGIGSAQVIGGNLSDLLQGPDLNVLWSITQDNGGNFSIAGDSPFGRVDFDGIENLAGGNSADGFTFLNQASLAGHVDGGLGINSLKIDDSGFTTEGTVTYDITNGLISQNPQYTFRSVDAVEIQSGNSDSTFNTQFFDFTQQLNGGTGNNTLNVTLAAGVTQPAAPSSPLTQAGSGQIAYTGMNSVNFANQAPGGGDNGPPVSGGGQPGGNLPGENGGGPAIGGGGMPPNEENGGGGGPLGGPVNEIEGQIGTQLDNTTDNSNQNGDPQGEQPMQQTGDEGDDDQDPDPAAPQPPAGNAGNNTPPGEEKPVTNESGVQETTDQGTLTVTPPPNVDNELDDQLGQQGQNDFQSTGLNIN